MRRQEDGESLIALGSISSAQRFFDRAARQAADAKAAPRRPHPSARQLPAMGALTLEEGDEEDELEPPPEPGRAVVTAPEDVLAKEDRELLSWKDVRLKVLAELDLCTARWGLLDHVGSRSSRTVSSASFTSDRPGAASPASEHSDEPASLVLDLLLVTSRAVRTVQSFVSALPPEIIPQPKQRRSSSHDPPPSDSPLSARHASHATLSTAARPKTLRPSLGPTLELPAPIPAEEDPLAQLRKASLEVLGAMRDMDARFRIGGQAQTEDGAIPEANDGHLYQQATLDDVSIESSTVRAWLQAVDRVLRAVAKHMRPGRTRTDDDETDATDPVSPEMTREPSETLPVWARMDESLSPLGRAHALLVAHLPVQLLSALPFAYEPEDRVQLLTALADGQLLVVAHNAILRASPSPWGLIPPHSVHDVRTLVAQSKSADGAEVIGLKFRRSENLRVWLAAIKLRYRITLSKDEFDVKIIARRAAEDQERWLAMLETAVTAWTAAIVAETRSQGGAAAV